MNQHYLWARVLPTKEAWPEIYCWALASAAQVNMHNLGFWKPRWGPQWRGPVSIHGGCSTGMSVLHRQVMQLLYLTSSCVSEQSELSGRYLISQHFNKCFSYPYLLKISQNVSAIFTLLCNPSEFCYYSYVAFLFYFKSVNYFSFGTSRKDVPACDPMSDTAFRLSSYLEFQQPSPDHSPAHTTPLRPWFIFTSPYSTFYTLEKIESLVFISLDK